MSAPNHHPPEDLLLEYASGTAPEAVALFVATHLALCPPCRLKDAGLDDLGGELLDALEPAALSAGGLGFVLSQLDDEPEEPAQPPPPAAAPRGGYVLPQPLRSYVGPVADIRWKRILPGLQQIELPLQLDGVPVRLTRLMGGTFVPRHTHTDEELSLVLAGGFTDERGHYVRGDVSCCDVDDTHAQKIDRGEPCIILATNRGRIVPVDWIGRIAEKLTGGF